MASERTNFRPHDGGEYQNEASKEYKENKYFDDRPDLGQQEITIKWSWIKKLYNFLIQGKKNRIERHRKRVNKYKNKIRKNVNTKVSRRK